MALWRAYPIDGITNHRAVPFAEIQYLLAWEPYQTTNCLDNVCTTWAHCIRYTEQEGDNYIIHWWDSWVPESNIIPNHAGIDILDQYKQRNNLR